MGKNTLVSLVAILLIGLGLGIAGGGAFLKMKAQEGLDAIQAMAVAQDVKLSYNADGQLTDRGKPAAAQAILDMLVNDWKFPVDMSELDPADPLVNTASEMAYQAAVINYHVLHGTQTVVLAEDAEYDANGDDAITEDEIFAAGEYEVDVDGRFWTGFNRLHPLDGPARSGAWETTHGLLALINVGMNSAFDGMLAVGLGWMFMALGGGFVLAGVGMFAMNGKRG